jgi:AcrR family transcriptional regulator
LSRSDAVTPERPYGGRLAEERRAARRTALLEAGLEVLGTQGAQAATVRAVCRQAGLSTSYFYESFANPEELFLAVFDHVVGDHDLRMSQRILKADGDLRASIAAAVHALADILEDPRAIRIVFLEAWGSEALMQRRVGLMHASAASLAQAISAAHPAARATKVHIAALAIAGGLLETLLAWIDGQLDASIDRLLHDFIDLSVGTMKHALDG